MHSFWDVIEEDPENSSFQVDVGDVMFLCKPVFLTVHISKKKNFFQYNEFIFRKMKAMIAFKDK